jgi:hypothetical protein
MLACARFPGAQHEKILRPGESLTEEEARQRHTDCEQFAIFALYDGKESRRAIFVWRTPDSAGKAGAVAAYWEKKGQARTFLPALAYRKEGVWR